MVVSYIVTTAAIEQSVAIQAADRALWPRPSDMVDEVSETDR